MDIIIPKTREEKIEEARRSGLIGKDNKLAGAKYGQEIVCHNCGSRDVIVWMPRQEDFEKGVEIPYTCKKCGYNGSRVGRLRSIKEDDTLVIDLVPEILVGLEGYGSLIGSYY